MSPVLNEKKHSPENSLSTKAQTILVRRNVLQTGIHKDINTPGLGLHCCQVLILSLSSHLSLKIAGRNAVNSSSATAVKAYAFNTAVSL